MPTLRRFVSVLLFLIALPLCLAAPAPATRIVVHKGERRLELRQDGEVVKTYRIGLGHSPTGTKLRQGDGRTPEGVFYVCVKNPKSRFHLSLGLSYPAPADAARGLKEKLITRAQHDAIVAAHEKRTTPPWNTALGGEIFIHGCGSGSDWTLGCIALDDTDMTELFARIATGTVVEIRP
jgi:murein L,D-transpeptidase YafK